MGNRPSTIAIFAIPLTDADWHTDGVINPAWAHLAGSPEDIEGGFEEVFWPIPAGPVSYHSYYYCGSTDAPHTNFVGVTLWEGEWYGESPPLSPGDEQRAALQAFLDSVGLGDRTPAIHVLVSYG